MTRETIKSIVDNEFQVPAEADLADLLSQLMKLLGSTDACLRENSLEILWHWGQAGRYSDEQFIELGQQMAGNLSVGLGETGTDSVFLRAFSALILGMVLYVDQLCELNLIEGRATFLEKAHVLRWYESALASLNGEQDLRGYTDESGWAHAVAHMGDALSHFARSRHLGSAELEKILTTIADRVIRPTDVVFSFDEDNRLMRSVYNALLRDELSRDFLQSWIQKLAHTQDGQKWGSVFGLEHCDHRGTRGRMNARAFLRSLYFLLKLGMRGAPDLDTDHMPYYAYYERPIPAREALLADIIEALKSMNRPLYRADTPTE